MARFKLRQGVRFLKVCGEKLSSDVVIVIPFQRKKMLAIIWLKTRQKFTAETKDVLNTFLNHLLLKIIIKKSGNAGVT